MVRLLFVCLGNICRSPTAEAIMQAYVERANLTDKIACDSAGTAGYHSGDAADPRSIKHGLRRGYKLSSRARKIYPEQDFEKFNYILTMDLQNYRNVQLLQKNDRELTNKLFPICKFCSRHETSEVPDPYLEGPDGFEKVIDILEDACEGLLVYVRKQHGL